MLATSIRRHDGQSGLTLIEILVSIIILAIISTMLIMGWVNLQRASATALSTNQARASLRDAMSRISKELRAAQPTALPTASPSATLLPLVELAEPMEVEFHSAFNSSDANLDGTGVSALRLTRIWLDVDTVPPTPWNPDCRTLYWQRDMDGNGSFADVGDRSIILARNVANDILEDAAHGADYTAVFRYGYRESEDDPVEWTDNEDGSLDLSTVVAVAVRLIIDKKMGGAPSYVDLTTTIRLRNATGVE
jgi:prepilin-type N-terminal cleavage/methylation domain-containing protein